MHVHASASDLNKDELCKVAEITSKIVQSIPRNGYLQNNQDSKDMLFRPMNLS